MKKSDIHDDVRSFTYTIREIVMEYYKGTCVDKMATSSDYGLRLKEIAPPEGSGNNGRAYTYERREHEIRHPLRLLHNGVPLMELWKTPHEALFYPGVWNRSDEYTAVRSQLEDFFTKYLPGVTLKENTNSSLNRNDDGSSDSLIRSSQRGDDPPPLEDLTELDWGVEAINRYGMGMTTFRPIRVRQGDRIAAATYDEYVRIVRSQSGDGIWTGGFNDTVL